jgi:mRNA-degrading endonuclease RelE of RelBE toxin-antitoxin system
MVMKLQSSESFVKSLRQLPQETRAKVRKQLKLLLQDFRYPSLHTEKLEGEVFAGEDVWSIRIDRKHRLKFIIRKEEQIYFLIVVGKHDIYRKR